MNMAHHFHQGMAPRRATALAAPSSRPDSRLLLALCLASCLLASWSSVRSAPARLGAAKSATKVGAAKPLAKPLAKPRMAKPLAPKALAVRPVIAKRKPAVMSKKVTAAPAHSGTAVQSQARVISSSRSRAASRTAASRTDSRTTMQTAARRFMQRLLGRERMPSPKPVAVALKRPAPKVATAIAVAVKAPLQAKRFRKTKPVATAKAKPSVATAMLTGRGQMLTSLGLSAPSRIAPADAPATLWARGTVAQSSLTPPPHLTMPLPALSNVTQRASARSRIAKNTATAKNRARLWGLSSAKAPRPAQTRVAPSDSLLQAAVAANSAHTANGRLTSVALPRPLPVAARAALTPASTTSAPESRPVRVIRAGTAPWLDRILQVNTASSAKAPLKYASATASGQARMLTPAKQATRLAAARQQAAARKPVFAVPSDAKGAPSASWARRKVITVASLKQLPPATEPLPIWYSGAMRGAVIPADPVASNTASALPPSLPRLSASPDGHVRSNAQAGGLWAQNAGAPPLRQPSRPVTNSDRLPNQLEVSVGTFVVLLTTSDLDTVAVAEPSIADVAVVNTRAVLVNGKAPGVTSLVVVDRFKIRQYQVRVVAAPGGLPRDIAAQIALPGVGVRQVRDAIVLEGEVDSAEEVRRAVEIAGIYATKVINQLTVRGALGTEAALATQIQNTINLPNVTAKLVGDTVVLDGIVENMSQFDRAQTVATALGKKVLNLIKLPTLTVEQLRQGLDIGSEAPGGVAPNDTTPDGAATGGAANNLNGAMLPGMTARQVGDQIILEGYATSQARIDEAVALAGRTGLQVVNRLQVVPVVAAEVTYRNTVERSIYDAGVRGVTVSGNEKLAILLGTVPDSNVAILAEQVARAYAGEVQNLLQVSNPLLVDIDVAFVEITKASARNLGVSFTDPIVFGETIVGGTVRRQTPIQASLSALIRNDQARLLSRPRTTVRSGLVAGFLAGGQVPIPAASTTNQAGTSTAIEFKDFGILVNVIPTANASGSVALRIFTQVSQPDFTIGVIPPGGGSAIPGFSSRSAVSELIVPPGGSISLGGMIQNNVTQFTSRIPVLSRIPFIGKLFTSKRFQRDETELVIFVTPRLLPNPLRAGETAPFTVVSGVDNPGTPTFGTGAIQIGPKSENRSQGGQGGAAPTGDSSGGGTGGTGGSGAGGGSTPR